MKILSSSLNPDKVFYTVFGALFLISAINLAYIPIAWVDEIGYLDPALQWVKKGNFSSNLWNVPGTADVFAAQLPFLIWVQAFFNALLGTGPLQARIYEIPAAMACIFFLYRYLQARYSSFHIWIPLLLCLLLFTDQFFYESLRSGRMEILGMALLAASLYLHQLKSYPGIRALLVSFLFLTHPAFWPAALIMLILLLKDLKAEQQGRIIFATVLFLAPLAFYATLLRFDFHSLYAQLVSHGEGHRIGTLPGDMLSKHFWFRFCDYYRGQYSFDSYFQPLHPLLNLLCFAWAIHQFMRRGFNSQAIVFLLLSTHILWFIFLGPFKRYTPQLIMLNYMALPFMIRSFRFSQAKLGILGIRIIIIISLAGGLAYFSALNTLALVQRPYRDAGAMLKWIDSNIPRKDEYIMAGEAIGYFHADKHKTRFFLEGLSDPENFRSPDKKVYFLTYDSIPEKLIAVYQPQGSSLSERFRNKSVTYRGMRLYELKDHLSLRNYVSE